MLATFIVDFTSVLSSILLSRFLEVLSVIFVFFSAERVEFEGVNDPISLLRKSTNDEQ
jgi:hypothetical protein